MAKNIFISFYLSMKCQPITYPIINQNNISVKGRKFPVDKKSLKPCLGKSLGILGSIGAADLYIKNHKKDTIENVKARLRSENITGKQKECIIDLIEENFIYNNDLKNCENLLDFLIENTSKDTEIIVQQRTDYNIYQYRIKDKAKNITIEVEINDNKLDVIKKTELSTNRSIAHSKTTFQDKRSIEETEVKGKLESRKYDARNNETYRMKIEDSKIKGEFNITETQNNLSKVTSSIKGKSKDFDITKDLTSPDGIESKYKRAGTPEKYSVEYKISDKDGNTLLDFNRKFRIIDNDRTVSEVNGQKYINTFDILGVESKKVDNDDNLLDTHFMIVNWQFEDILKKFPADIFYTMQKNKIRLIIDNCDNERNAFMKGNIMHLSSDLRNDYFVFAHEIGHVKSHELGELSNDEELKLIFEKEKEETKENIGEILKDKLQYFIMNPYGLEEVAAETYAILSGLDHNGITPPTGIRTTLLMKYFPETIAYIANKIINSEQKIS